MRDFHVRRTARERYAIDDVLLGIRGDLITTDVAAIRRLAARMNAGRPPGAASIAAGEISALGLLHEIGHLLVARFDASEGAPAMAAALVDVRRAVGTDVDALLDRFADDFPGVGPTPEPPVVRLEELLLTRIANENPAIGPLRELIDDRILGDGTRYEDVIAGLERSFGAGPGLDVEGRGSVSLIELMRTPARHAPTSLVGQLRYVREQWAAWLGHDLEAVLGRIDLSIGILLEEERALHLRFGGGAAGPARDRPVELPAFAGLAEEPEAFSTDSAWMPRVVLLARSTYVWLDQLSRRIENVEHFLQRFRVREIDRVRSPVAVGDGN
ncbi:MAG: hypothetical protein ACTS8Z_00935, partial [Candidatus Limnocylindrales bacterium]